MKKLSRILTAVLTLAMVFTLNVSVFATSNVTDGATASAISGGDTTTLNVTTGNEGDTLNAYKVIDTAYNSTANTVNSDFTTTFKAFMAASTNYNELTVDAYAALSTDDLEDLLGEFAVYVKTNSTAATYTSSTVSSEGKASFTNVAMGQYIIVGAGNNNGAKIYQTVTAEVQPVVIDKTYKLYDSYTVAMKTSEPTAEKKITAGTTADGALATASVGDTVSFEISATVPTYPAKATNKTFFMADTLSTGLTLDADSIVVKADGTTMTTGYTVKVDGQKFYVDFTYDSIKANTKVTVEYNTTLNANAVLGTIAGNVNDYKLIYSNSPFDGTTYDPEDTNRPEPTTPGYGSDEDEETVYTYAIAIDKFKDGETTTKLSGATFEVYANEGCTGDALATITTDANGIATFTGIKAGTYYLKETVAPAGYKLLSAPVEVAVNSETAVSTLNEGSTAIIDATATASGYTKVSVANKEGSSLPATGGMGTRIFTIAGILIMVAAALALVLKRKTTK